MHYTEYIHTSIDFRFKSSLDFIFIDKYLFYNSPVIHCFVSYCLHRTSFFLMRNGKFHAYIALQLREAKKAIQNSIWASNKTKETTRSC